MLAKALISLVAIGGAFALLNQGAPKESLLVGARTSLDNRTPAQRHNAELACLRLTHAVIKPGEIFSFNERVGNFTRDQGYRKAPVSYDGVLIQAWGGGVCETSTTLYNAALRAGLVVLERHPHRFCPSYIAAGLDAAVAYGIADLKFRNPYDFPITIEAKTDDAAINVKLLGDGTKIPAVEVTRKVHQQMPSKLYLIDDTPYSHRVRSQGKGGSSVTVYRTINGVTEQISTDSYPALARTIEGDRR
ncbi:MAG: VanW family protein [Armatimonadetes bacterium]|nr:VanW family protein [Armatimonadota bacterium]